MSGKQKMIVHGTSSGRLYIKNPVVERAIKINALVASLLQAPSSMEYVTVNDIRNLAILDKDGVYVGYIDFYKAKLVPIEGEEIDAEQKLSICAHLRNMLNYIKGRR